MFHSSNLWFVDFSHTEIFAQLLLQLRDNMFLRNKTPNKIKHTVIKMIPIRKRLLTNPSYLSVNVSVTYLKIIVLEVSTSLHRPGLI